MDLGQYLLSYTVFKKKHTEELLLDVVEVSSSSLDFFSPDPFSSSVSISYTFLVAVRATLPPLNSDPKGTEINVETRANSRMFDESNN